MINAQTQIYGIIGNPVRHSLSPVLHNGAFRRMGLNGAYLVFEVNHLEDAIRGIRGLGIRGVSVTIPYKTRVIPLLDEVEKVARKIGAVNTISNQEGRLIGCNTDWLGAVEALEEKIDLQGKRVALLGAGGAARAIAYGLKEKGCRVFLFNRSPEKAAELEKELGFPCGSLSSVEKIKLDVEVLINATPIGMVPHDGESPLPKEILQKGMTVMDIVYRPLRTKLLREAEERGCRVIDGLEMLARQGALQIEVWTGKRPGVEDIKKDLIKALEK